MTSSMPAGGGSAFASRQAAQRALAMVLPMIEPLMQDRSVVGSGFLAIVVLDPALDPTQATFEDAVLAEHVVGDRSQWDADYAAFARDKARLAWRLQRDSGEVQALSPHRLRGGDTLLAGAVCLDGIVVGVSGAHAHYDEAIALAVAGCLRALCKQAWLDAREANRLRA